jgi:ribosome-associated translation inhibitor RaiA
MKRKTKQIKVNFENVDHSFYLIDYLKRKIQKPKLSGLNLITDNINIKKDHSKGVAKYVLTVKVTVNNLTLFFKEIGDDIYLLIDSIVKKINRKLSKIKTNHVQINPNLKV